MNHDNKGKKPFHAYHDPSPSAYPAPSEQTPALGKQPESDSQGSSLAARIAQSASSLARSAIAGPSSGATYGNDLASSLAGLSDAKASGSSSSSIASFSRLGDVGRYGVKHGASGVEGFRTEPTMQQRITPEEVQAMLDEFDPSSGSIAPFTTLDICKMGYHRPPRAVSPSLAREHFLAATHPDANVRNTVPEEYTQAAIAEWRDQQLANGSSPHDDQTNQYPDRWRTTLFPEDAIWNHDAELAAWVRENHPFRPWSSSGGAARWRDRTGEEGQWPATRMRIYRNNMIADKWMELRQKRGPPSAEDQERWELFYKTLPSKMGGIEKWQFEADREFHETGKKPSSKAAQEETKEKIRAAQEAFGESSENDFVAYEGSVHRQSKTKLKSEAQQMAAAWKNAISQHDINMTSEWDNQPAIISTKSHHNTTIPSHDIPAFASHDGDDVLAILKDPSSVTSTDILTTSLADTATPSADDLFPDAAHPVAPFSAQSNDAHDSAALPTSPSSTLRRLTLPGADLSDPVVWLQDWERALTNYTDDVWDPASVPWVQEAREAIGEVAASEEQKGGDRVAGNEAREKALRRLRMLVGHVRIAEGGSTKMSMYAVPDAT